MLLSTYHPQIDGGTERWNQEISQIALNISPNATGLSQLYITHVYHLAPIDIIPVSKALQPGKRRAEPFSIKLTRNTKIFSKRQGSRTTKPRILC